MAQYIYTTNRLAKVVPPKRYILRDISVSFFPGAKIGVLGLNGSGKSTLLKIMAGVDKDFEGEARPQPGIKIGFLSQEPELDPTKTVRAIVEEGIAEIMGLIRRFNQISDRFAGLLGPQRQISRIAGKVVAAVPAAWLRLEAQVMTLRTSHRFTAFAGGSGRPAAGPPARRICCISTRNWSAAARTGLSTLTRSRACNASASRPRP